MAAAGKVEMVNGSTPMPQRNQKNQGMGGGNQGNKNKQNHPQNQNQQKQQPDILDGAPAEKKPRFTDGPGQGGGERHQGNMGNQGGGNQGGGGGNQGGGGGRGPGGPGQQGGNFRQGGRGFGNRGNRNRDRSNRSGKDEPNEGGNVHILDEEEMMRGGNRGGGGGGGGLGGGQFNRGGGGDRMDRRSGGGGGGRGGGGGFGRNDDFFIAQRLRSIAGPTHELPPIEEEDGKFSGRNRLYVGNLTSDVNEEELREMFKPYGEIGEIFANSEKNFAFLKVDYHANAEKAKRELDGTVRKNRSLRVRFAPNATILRIKNLTSCVSNELLYKCFEVFGPVERAVVKVDDRGKPTGEGIVEFAKKNSAMACLRLCSEKCFFLTASLRPCVVETLEINDENDGLPEKALNKKTQEFHEERSVGPRFADHGSFEHEYGTRWKQLYELYKTKQEALTRELKMEEDKLEAQMEFARYEHETEMLRQELRKREQDNERKKMEWEMREKQAEEIKARDEENMRRQQSEMQSRMLRQEEEMRRRQQENTLFMQAQQLNSLLDQQEGKQGGGSISESCPPAPGAGTSFESFEQLNQNNPAFDFRDALSVFAGNNIGAGNNGPNNPQDQFPFEFGGNNQQNQGGGGAQNQRGGGGGGGSGSGGNANNNNKPWERRRRF